MIINLNDYIPPTDNTKNKISNIFSELICDFIDYAIDDNLSYLVKLFDDIGGSEEFISFLYSYDIYTTHVYVYVESNIILGFISYSNKDKICNINYLAVDKNHRHNGIGYNLVKHVLDLNMNFDNVEKYCLLVSVNNTNALKLYLKFGFSIAEIIENAYRDEGCGIYTDDGVHAYKMELNISHWF